MVRSLVGLIVAVGVLSANASGDTTFKSALHDYRVVTVVDTHCSSRDHAAAVTSAARSLSTATASCS